MACEAARIGAAHPFSACRSLTGSSMRAGSLAAEALQTSAQFREDEGALLEKKAWPTRRKRDPPDSRRAALPRGTEEEEEEAARPSQEPTPGEEPPGVAPRQVAPRQVELELREVGPAELAATMEGLRATCPIRKGISPPTAAFVATLLGLGVSGERIGRMFAWNSRLFARSSEGLLEKCGLLAAHGFTPADVRRLLAAGSNRWLSKAAAEVDNTIRHVKALVGDDAAARRLFVVGPELLGCSAGNLEEKARRLAAEGVQGLPRIVTKFPGVFYYRADEVAARVAGVREIMGPELSAAVLARQPTLLRANVATMRECLQWAEATFGRAAARAMVAAQPGFLAVPAATARGTYSRLAAAFGEGRAVEMLRVQPRLLSFKWRGLEPKVQYLTGVAAYGLGELAAAPDALLYSLERRIRPRAEALREAGVARRPTLSQLLRSTDGHFERAFGVRLGAIADTPGAGTPQRA